MGRETNYVETDEYLDPNDPEDYEVKRLTEELREAKLSPAALQTILAVCLSLTPFPEFPMENPADGGEPVVCECGALMVPDYLHEMFMCPNPFHLFDSMVNEDRPADYEDYDL
jgi:hypothetical protein